MRRWRVGTLSMGMVLIAAGALLLFAQINQVKVLNQIMKWWPAVLLLLGGEVLWYAYRGKEESPKVKYDVFSIFIIFIIVSISMVIYGLSEIGLVSQFQKMVSAQNFTQVSDQTISLDNSIKKIVVESVQDSMDVRFTKEKMIRVRSTADVTADNRGTAAEILGDSQVKALKSGDTLYLSFNSVSAGSDLGYHARIIQHTLLIPEDRAWEIHNQSSLKLYADYLSSDCVIDGSGDTEIRLGKEADVKVEVSSEEPLRLGGNVKWTVSGEENGEQGPFRGTYVWGAGMRHLNVIGAGPVDIYQMN
ncbi:hypothetical protein [Candidatus Formimonas warabiya]|uniref:DUF5668 domain-containing protein n=1 Tax=Formimonas warabiya TaxID=1761012 RepID=A0A3G1KVW1_FORW1|nr:hypothetical protein [Candidatus Formimonas warabiya]ATW26499.1 hypothetical protein DCMF_18635 [Candidatus Formimonas warabiya]